MILFEGLLVAGQAVGLSLTGLVVYLIHKNLKLLDGLDVQLALVSLGSLFLYRSAIFLIFVLEFLHTMNYGSLTVVEKLVLPVFVTFFWVTSAITAYLVILRRLEALDGND